MYVPNSKFCQRNGSQEREIVDNLVWCCNSAISSLCLPAKCSSVVFGWHSWTWSEKCWPNSLKNVVSILWKMLAQWLLPNIFSLGHGQILGVIGREDLLQTILHWNEQCSRRNYRELMVIWQSRHTVATLPFLCISAVVSRGRPITFLLRFLIG